MSPTTFDHGYALLIGVGEIAADPAWSLPVTVKDALALQQLLTDPNACAYPADKSHVRVLHDSTATRARIIQEMAWLGDRARADSDATIVVFYSGHGFYDQAPGKYYLIQHDVKPFDIPGSAIDAEAFSDGLRAIPARRLLVILDCCHAQGMATSKDAPSIKTPTNFVSQAPPEPIAKSMRADPLNQGGGRAVFLSSLGDEKSWVRRDQTMSIYTHHLLEALQGANSRPGETEVRITDVANYLSRVVPETTKREYQTPQTPFFDWAAEDFPVALVLGGKCMPPKGWNAVQGEATERIDTIARTVSVVASGDRAVAIGGNVTNSPIVTGDDNTVQQARGRNAAQSSSGAATVNDHSYRAVFDQRGQTVETQYNVAGDFRPAAAGNRDDALIELRKLHAELKRAQEHGLLTRRTAIDAQRQVEDAVIAAEEPQPDRNIILRHLEQARDVINGVTAGVTATGGLVDAVEQAIGMVRRQF